MNTYTEEEARKKWCVVYAVKQGEFGTCSGSGCMAWRWGTEMQYRSHTEFSGANTLVQVDEGYCGLAGKP